jgi:hypothetical protein
MTDRVHKARARRNQLLFREVNERTKGLQATFGYFTERGSWVCECSDADCVEQVELTLPEYDWVRSDPRHFLVVPGHADTEVERVIVDGGRFAVVELQQGAPPREASELLYYYRLGSEPGFDYVSEVVTEWIDYTPEEHYADPGLGHTIVHPDDRVLLEELSARPELSPVTIRWIARDGHLVVTEHDVAPVTNGYGDVVAIAGRATLVAEATSASRANPTAVRALRGSRASRPSSRAI